MFPLTKFWALLMVPSWSLLVHCKLLRAAQLAVKVAEETSITLRAQRDKAMDKAIRAGRILMRRPGVVVPDDIRADVNAAPDSSSRPSSSIAPEKDIAK